MTRPEEGDGPALFGDLARFPVGDVLQFIGFLGLTGRLEIQRETESGEERVDFRIYKGRIVEAVATGTKLRLGELLVSRYDVALEAVLDQLRYQARERREKRPVSRLGELLRARGYLEDGVLQDALNDAVTRIAVRALTWKNGRFSYWALEDEPPEELTAQIPLEDFILERWQSTETFS